MKVVIGTNEYQNFYELRKELNTKQFFVGLNSINIPEIQAPIKLQITDENDAVIEDKNIVNVSQAVDYLNGKTFLILQYE